MIIGSTSYFMRAKYRDFQKMENLTDFTLKTDLKFAFFFFFLGNEFYIFVLYICNLKTSTLQW